MIKRLTVNELTTYTGYTRQTFQYWTKTKPTTENVFRYEALSLGAALLREGYNFDLVDSLESKIKKQEAQIARRDIKIKNYKAVVENLEEDIENYEEKINQFADLVEGKQ